MYQVPHYIGGKKIPPSGKTKPIYNPATGEQIGEVALADITVINQAVTAATAAFNDWSKFPPIKKARILYKFKALLESNITDLAKIITKEHGKTLEDAKGSVQRGIDVVEFACGIPSHLQGKYMENVATDIDSFTLKQPIGVCAGITPFNFPAMIPLWMFPISIACGNSFILKPSEKDPSCALKIVELAIEAGVPDGVVNIVQGDDQAVNMLLQHPDIAAISFVGSTKVAEHVYKTAAQTGKRVQAFAGAKNHCVLMGDADLKHAADNIIGAAYGSAGERCMAISVVVTVGDEVADNLIAEIKSGVAKLKIGPGDKPNIDMGPLITKEHLQRVSSYLDIGLKEGAKLVIDGRDQKFNQGYFLGASLFDCVSPNMQIYKDEIFGPILSIVRTNSFAEALDIVNNNEFGNGAAIFTRDGEIAHAFSSKVKTGMVGVNIPIPVPSAYHSFGGNKKSMFGDIGMHGAEGINFFTRQKKVLQRWIKSKDSSKFIMPTHE